jgi:hypothetical protein
MEFDLSAQAFDVRAKEGRITFSCRQGSHREELFAPDAIGQRLGQPRDGGWRAAGDIDGAFNIAQQECGERSGSVANVHEISCDGPRPRRNHSLFEEGGDERGHETVAVLIGSE